MLPLVKDDLDRAKLLAKVVNLLRIVQLTKIFKDLITSIQAVLIEEIEKCHLRESKEIIYQSMEDITYFDITEESRTILTPVYNKLMADLNK